MRILNKDKEVRNFQTNFEIRNEEDQEQKKVVGYALKFNKWSEDLGGFIEIIDRHALDNCDMADVRCLIDHDSQKILGRTTNNTLKLAVDDIGLRFECTPSNTSYSRDLITNMKAGNINQCSFGFILNWDNNDCDTWEYDKERDIYKRTVKDIKTLFDVSPVTFPAYTQTECVVAERKLEDLHKEKNRELLKRKLKMELELM
jgi:hypothetical protein